MYRAKVAGTKMSKNKNKSVRTTLDANKTRKLARDFLTTFVVVTAFCLALTSFKPNAPVPILSLMQTDTHNAAIITTLLAAIFSAIIAFNFALIRHFEHLRRERASSRRGAWRGG